MAGATVVRRATGAVDSDVRALRVEFNKLVDDLETLRASVAAICTKLNADTGVTDTNYTSTAAAALLAGKVATENGNTTS